MISIKGARSIFLVDANVPSHSPSFILYSFQRKGPTVIAICYANLQVLPPAFTHYIIIAIAYTMAQRQLPRPNNLTTPRRPISLEETAEYYNCGHHDSYACPDYIKTEELLPLLLPRPNRQLITLGWMHPNHAESYKEYFTREDNKIYPKKWPKHLGGDSDEKFRGVSEGAQRMPLFYSSGRNGSQG